MLRELEHAPAGQIPPAKPGGFERRPTHRRLTLVCELAPYPPPACEKLWKKRNLWPMRCSVLTCASLGRSWAALERAQPISSLRAPLSPLLRASAGTRRRCYSDSGR